LRYVPERWSATRRPNLCPAMFCNVANFPMSDYTKTQGGVGMTRLIPLIFAVSFAVGCASTEQAATDHALACSFELIFTGAHP